MTPARPSGPQGVPPAGRTLVWAIGCRNVEGREPGVRKRMGQTFEVVCIGGGIIGLATAYELAGRGESVSIAVLDRGRIGSEASWAGAGILPPVPRDDRTPLGTLRQVSYDRFPALAEDLAKQTGIDVGFRRSGGVEVALSAEEAAGLNLAASAWESQQVRAAPLTREALGAREPALAAGALLPLLGTESGCAAFWLPEYCQVRNPRLVRALAQACSARGVALLPETPVVAVEWNSNRVRAIRLASGETIGCGALLISAGAWSGPFLEEAGLAVPIRPIRGQIVAFQSPGGLLAHIVSCGKRYLVPRADGLVLAGSTEEDVGFDKHTSAEGIAGLTEFAFTLAPSLRSCPIAHTWAGLRPASDLDFPLLGRVPGWSNLWVATGHFRQGLQLSPGTGRLLADWISGTDSFASPTWFIERARQHLLATARN